MNRGVVAAVGAGVALLAAGCGQTDYATQVTEDSAQLNGTITTLTENVTTTAWFEYWPTANSAAKQQTPDQDITSAGPISDDVSGLANHTEYQYRLCGTEDDSEVVCAQTRRFTTGRDTVQAYGDTEIIGNAIDGRHWFEGLDFDVVAGPTGVSGPAFATSFFSAGTPIVSVPLGSHTAPNVTCFEVNGNVAVIGLNNPERSNAQQSFVMLVDGGGLGSGQDAVVSSINDWPPHPEPDRIPSDCSPIQKTVMHLTSGEIVVNEAPPAPG